MVVSVMSNQSGSLSQCFQLRRSARRQAIDAQEIGGQFVGVLPQRFDLAGVGFDTIRHEQHLNLIAETNHRVDLVVQHGHIQR